MKKLLIAAAVLTALGSQITACASDDYSWAATEIQYCKTNLIMTGDEYGNLHPEASLTRAEMAKMLVEGFDLEYNPSASFSDVPQNVWYYDYAKAIKDLMVSPDSAFRGDEIVSREEFAATLVRAMGYKESNLNNTRILEQNFTDAYKVSDKYKKLLSIAVERALYRGSDYRLLPNENLTRAEVCTLLYRAIELKKGNISFTYEDLGVPKTETSLLGNSEVSMESAIKWAKAHDCSDLFVDAAQYYWKYGELTGIRPDILYAQSAKETAYGRYGGRVLPEMNNFAGIKKYGAVNDATEDHETFATREDGVRGHFNHMCAYVGIEPIGDVHGRYNSVKSLAWAGSVKTAEALGGKWCPDLYYGYDIIKSFLADMKKY